MKRMKSVEKNLTARMLVILACCAIFIGLTGCLDDDDNNTINVPVAYVALYQGSPDAPGLDVEVDDNQVNSSSFDYTEYTNYVRFYTGDRNLKFGPFASSSIQLDTTVKFENNKAYSVFVADEYENLEIVILDDNTAAPASGKAKVRVINLSPDAGPIDLLAQGSTNRWASDLGFKKATDFTEVNATEYDFEVKSSSDDETLLSLPAIRLQSRYYYTIVIRGYDNPPGGNTNVLAAQIIVN